MDEFIINTEIEFDIIYNAYRTKIINAFGKAEHMTATFKQIADTLGDASSKVTYHGKKLINIGLLELDHTKVVNGITAKYYKLVSDSFKVALKGKDSDMIRKKIMKGQSAVVLESLEEMTATIGNFDQESRSLSFAMNDLYLTQEELNTYWDLVKKLSSKKEAKADTKKVTLYTLVINNKPGECQDKE